MAATVLLLIIIIFGSVLRYCKSAKQHTEDFGRIEWGRLDVIDRGALQALGLQAAHWTFPQNDALYVATYLSFFVS